MSTPEKPTFEQDLTPAFGIERPLLVPEESSNEEIGEVIDIRSGQPVAPISVVDTESVHEGGDPAPPYGIERPELIPELSRDDYYDEKGEIKGAIRDIKKLGTGLVSLIDSNDKNRLRKHGPRLAAQPGTLRDRKDKALNRIKEDGRTREHVQWPDTTTKPSNVEGMAELNRRQAETAKLTSSNGRR